MRWMILLIIGLLLTGCTRAVNHRLELGTLKRTSTFTIDRDLPDLDLTAPRSTWETSVFIAPIDGIAHGPTMRLWSVPSKTEPPRSYGLMPTTASAIDPQRESLASELLHTIEEIGSTIMMLIDPLRHYADLTSTPSSPLRVWKRSTQEDAWFSGASSKASSTQDDTNE